MDVTAIGYFSKVHGVKGALLLRVEKDFDLASCKVLFVEMSGDKAPYFLKSYQDVNVGLIVALEEVDVVEKARTLLSKKVYVQTELIYEDDTEFDYLGFELNDKIFGLLGKVVTISNNGSQTLIHVDHKGKEVILPWVDEMIDEIDETKKIIQYNAPDGLIDLYLEQN